MTRFGFRSSTRAKLDFTSSTAPPNPQYPALHSRIGLLQAVHVVDLAGTIDQVTDESEAFAGDLDQICDGTAGVAGRFDHLESQSLPGMNVTVLDANEVVIDIPEQLRSFGVIRVEECAILSVGYYV